VRARRTALGVAVCDASGHEALDGHSRDTPEIASMRLVGAHPAVSTDRCNTFEMEVLYGV
jgi:hypothetical protein